MKELSFSGRAQTGGIALSRDGGVGGVNHRHFLDRNALHFRRRAPRDQPVGVVLRGDAAIGFLDRLIVRIPVNAEDDVRVVLRRAQMANADPVKLPLGKAEQFGDL